MQSNDMKQKNFFLLLIAFKIIKEMMLSNNCIIKKFGDWKWTIYNSCYNTQRRGSWRPAVVTQAGCEEEQSGAKPEAYQDSSGDQRAFQAGGGMQSLRDASVHTGEGMETCKVCLMWCRGKNLGPELGPWPCNFCKWLANLWGHRFFTCMQEQWYISEDFHVG